MNRSKKLNLSQGNWYYSSGEILDSGVGSILKADRNNPKTSGAERDANALMAAKSKGMFTAILNFLVLREELEGKKRLTKADRLRMQEAENIMKWSIDDRSVKD